MRSGPARLVWGQRLPWKVNGNQWAQEVRIKTTGQIRGLERREEEVERESRRALVVGHRWRKNSREKRLEMQKGFMHKAVQRAIVKNREQVWNPETMNSDVARISVERLRKRKGGGDQEDEEGSQNSTNQNDQFINISQPRVNMVVLSFKQPL